MNSKLGRNFQKFDDLKYDLDIGYNYIYTAKGRNNKRRLKK